MAFQVSPGVQVKEIDLTSIIPSVSTTRAGFAGQFNKGPVGSRTLITSVNALRDVFGDPTDSNAVDFFSAANFLAYTNNLQIVRVVGSGAANASAKGSGDDRLIKTVSDYDAQFGISGGSAGGSFGTYAARTPGGEIQQGGNAFQVSSCDRTTLNITLLGGTGGGPGSGTVVAGTATGDAANSFLPVPVATDKVQHYIIEASGLTTAGITTDVADGQLDIANVGTDAEDNLRVKGIPQQPLRSITGITPSFATTITGDNAGAAFHFPTAGGGNVNLNAGTAYVGGTGGYVVFTGTTGGVSQLVIAQVHTLTSSAASGTTIGITFGAGYTTGVAGGLTLALNSLVQFAGMIEVGSTAQGQSGLTAASVDWRYRSNFSSDLPATSVDANDRGATNDLMHVAVIDQFGLFSGTKGDVVEVFDGVSKASNVKDTFGNNLFVQQRIRSDSDQVFLTGFSDRSSISGGVTSHSGTIAKTAHGVDAQSGVVFGTMIKPATVSLTGGTQGGVPSNKITNGYDQFEDSETVDVNILVGGGNTGADAISISNIASTRKDCIAFFSPPESAVLSGSGQNQSPKTSIVATANTVAYRRGENANESGGDVDFTSSNLNIDTSFSVMDSGWKLTFDRYNDKFRYIPLNADTAGVTVRTDIIAEPWFSPAGFNRGQVLGAVSLAYSPNQAERDDLYTNNINPVVAFPGQGTVLFGDKTLQQRPSAFDRINVRRLFIILEKAIATAAKFQLFEINDAFTRSQFKSLIDPFLRDVQARRGVVDFKVICDESNNPSSVVDRNEFVASIFIKPSRSINFITLNFVATGSGVNFQEIGA